MLLETYADLNWDGCAKKRSDDLRHFETKGKAKHSVQLFHKERPELPLGTTSMRPGSHLSFSKCQVNSCSKL